MNIKFSNISGLMIIEPVCYSDNRGKFVKIYSDDLYKDAIGDLSFKESYFSISAKNVIRGMHFQVPPKDHDKILYVLKGSTIDVVVDLRNGSPSFGQYFSLELSDQNHFVLFIPKGCAHGFLSLQDDTCMIYNQTSCYSAEHDRGILYSSFGFEWKLDASPLISSRDKSFPALNDFISPFKF